MGVHVSQLVNYTGSITSMHGLMHVHAPRGDRFELRTGHGQVLNKVRPESFTLVQTPTMTVHRAQCLKWLARTGSRPDTRTLNWLVSHQLATVNEDGRPSCTFLGFELAAATRITIH